MVLLRKQKILVLLSLLFTIFLIFSSHPACGDNIIIVESGCVNLRDIFDDSYPDVNILCGLKPGATRTISSPSVTSVLQRYGYTLTDIPPYYSVQRSSDKISLKELEEIILQEYNKKYEHIDFSIESIRLPKEINLSKGEKFSVFVNTSRFGNASGVITSLELSKASFSYTIKAQTDVYISDERIIKGEDIKSKVSKQYYDITNIRGEPVKSTDNIIASRIIPKGKVITNDVISEKPDRVKGDPIFLSYMSGDIRIEIKAVAEGDAIVGKTFPVKNPNSGKIITAVYLGNGKAAVY